LSADGGIARLMRLSGLRIHHSLQQLERTARRLQPRHAEMAQLLELIAEREQPES